MKDKSRYTGTRRFFAGDGGQNHFRGFRPRPIRTPAAVLEHEIKAWDRLDLLALNYYNDVHKWWRILDANPQIDIASDVNFAAGESAMVGEMLLIPRDI